MIVTIRTSGGFAGLTETIGPVDTAGLDHILAREIEMTLSSPSLASRSNADEEIGSDLIRYEIEIKDGAQTRVVRFADDGSPAGAPLRRVIEAAREAQVRGN